MPTAFRLPRGSAAIRGGSSVRHLASVGGQLAQKTNHLYMLTIRRESFVNKRNSILDRLKEIKGQLERIDKDMRATDQECRRLRGHDRPKKGRGQTFVDTEEKGFRGKKFKLEY